MWAREAETEGWTEAEALVALHVHDRLSGSPVSGTPDPLVVSGALLTGRSVHSFDRKVREFQDPRAAPTPGMENARQDDEVLWSRYFDPASGTLDSGRLELACLLAWGAPLESVPAPLADPEPGAAAAPAARRQATVSRIVRDTRVTQRVKERYGHQCQVCRVAIADGLGAHAEGAHVQPLGGGHEGPDVEGNVLCLCPNHHLMLDQGMIAITDDLQVVEVLSDRRLGPLHTHAEHRLDPACLRHHRDVVAARRLSEWRRTHAKGADPSPGDASHLVPGPSLLPR